MSVTDAPTDRIPLTAAQEFLRMFDAGPADGPFGPLYHVVGAWQVEGSLDLDLLRQALYDVVARHEALRTVVVRDQDPPHQSIQPPAQPRLTVRELSPSGDRQRQIEELLNEVEAEGNDVNELPLVQAVLGRFGEHDSVLMLNAHHTAADAWAMDRIAGDIGACYRDRSAGKTPELPETLQYQDYARWESEHLASPAADKARAYWRRTLDGAGVTTLPTDLPRSSGIPKETAWHRFRIDPGLVAATTDLASRTKSSPFMVLFTAHQLLLRKLTGVTDVVTPTFTPGRGHSRFRDTVGSFVNFMPLRTDLRDCATAGDAIARTRRVCVEAYSHDIPFMHLMAEAPQLMVPAMDEHRQVGAFQALRSPHMMKAVEVGDLKFTKLWRRELSQPVGSDVPDGILWTLHLGPGTDAVGSLGFNTNRFTADTMSDLLADYLTVLRKVVTNPDATLGSL